MQLLQSEPLLQVLDCEAVQWLFFTNTVYYYPDHSTINVSIHSSRQCLVKKGNSSPYILVNHVSINFTVQPNFDISVRVSEHFLHHRPSHCNGINLVSVLGQLLAWVLEKYSPRMLVLFNLYDCKLRSFSQKKTQKTYYALKLCTRCLFIF